MKLVVLIPVFNEEDTIEKIILNVPRKIFGIDKVEVLIVDDGSTDKTYDLALNAGADKIVSHYQNLGVGAAFKTGIKNAISMKADVVVTIDGDSQFDPKEIPKMVIPIINNQLDVVIGSRFYVNTPKNIPKIKLIGNKIFSKLISYLVGQKITDSQTGFRAYSKDTLKKIHVQNNFTYTQQTLIDLIFKDSRVGEIPVSVYYDKKRKSKVVKNIFSYTFRVLLIILESMMYRSPIISLGLIGSIFCLVGVLGKVLTISKILSISVNLTDAFVVVGVLSFLAGVIGTQMKKQTLKQKKLQFNKEDIDNF